MNRLRCPGETRKEQSRKGRLKSEVWSRDANVVASPLCTSDAAHFCLMCLRSWFYRGSKTVYRHATDRERIERETENKVKGQRGEPCTCLEIVSQRWLDHWRTCSTHTLSQHTLSYQSFPGPNHLLTQSFTVVHLFAANASAIGPINFYFTWQ